MYFIMVIYTGILYVFYLQAPYLLFASLNKLRFDHDFIFMFCMFCILSTVEVSQWDYINLAKTQFMSLNISLFNHGYIYKNSVCFVFQAQSRYHNETTSPYNPVYVSKKITIWSWLYIQEFCMFRIPSIVEVSQWKYVTIKPSFCL